MAIAPPQTPQKPLPGAFLATPAPQRRPSAISGFQSAFNPPFPPSSQNFHHDAPQRQNLSSLQGPQLQLQLSSGSESLTSAERAAKTINATLDQEARFPAMDNYINQGYSCEYEVPQSDAWAPFQRIKMYDIPDRIFEQYNQAQVSTMMGLFANLNHAWITIDNALYLWDYTNPNPELIGFEEQPNSITAVKLLSPRSGVFVEAISQLLVVATTSDIIIIGVAVQAAPAGTKTVSLYQTRMQVSVRGINVSCIEGSSKTGRIFFSGMANDDVYELTYQQEEKWFQNRCGKINHTRTGYAAVLPTISFKPNAPQDYMTQLVVDDTRNLLYTLSSTSTIKMFHILPPNRLDQRLSRALSSVMSDTGHKVGPNSLLSPSTTIVSINPIQDKEAQRLNLVATTSTGCRIFFSAVSGSYFGGSSNSPPTSMQVHHIKFPPPEVTGPPLAHQPPSNPLQLTGGAPPAEIQSKSLTQTRLSTRIPPGYFLCFVAKTPQAGGDTLFMSAPDGGRIARPQDGNPVVNYPEFGLWLTLESRAEDVGLVTPPFAAGSSPVGFGNELAVQYDHPASEIAVLTNSGVHTFRRRRLVDVFAAAIRDGSGEEGLEGEVKKFVRQYGRGETIATALAVACGQGADVTMDSRVAKITDPDILEHARKVFIDYGGKPTLNENQLIDQGASNIDNVRPSPRHDGIRSYISRILRSVWKSPLLRESQTPTGGLSVSPTVPLSKLQDVQRDLTRLQEFLKQNESFIEGLTGPDALGRVSTKQEETALKGEHRALYSLVKLISDVIEGISFVLVLFDERVDEILLAVPPEVGKQARQITFEGLFCTDKGKDLAKELVKAIVNRNITSGSNVDTVTDALRRRCGSFCSADDCIIFKAQEQLKKASEAGTDSESSRTLLNESLRLLQRVAASLSMEQLRWAVEQYTAMSFYAGAIQLALSVAHEADRGNRALAWVNEGSLASDIRVSAFENRAKCYELIHQIINAVDEAAIQIPEMIDGQFTVMAKRKRETYDIINGSQDEVFQINLYDWYLSQGWSERLLDVKSPFVIKYLQRKSGDDLARANLLWRYYAQYNDFLEAATVQMQLAKSDFDLNLEQRIEFLSRAKANASTKTVGMSEIVRSRQSRQELVREVSDLLEIANIQGDLLQRIKADPRLSLERRPQVVRHLDGQILPLDELYNGYADQASYHDICLLIYQCAEYRNPADIRATWQNLLETTHDQTLRAGTSQPFEAVADIIRTLGTRLNFSESTFSIPMLLPMLERYSFEYQRGICPPTWVVDIFLDLKAPYEFIITTLENLLYNDEKPFQGRNRRYISTDLLHVIQRWFFESVQQGIRVFGGEDNAVTISQTLQYLQTTGLDAMQEDQCQALRTRIDQLLR